jgi:hypothetical protein
MTARPGKHDDELISASLTGDLSEDEQAALDRHLADCARCRETLAAFAEERRLISGMRHVAPPRELGARVRAGIESGATPWWRRPGLLVGIGASLATVTAAVLAVVVLGDIARGPVASSGSPLGSASVGASIAATASASPSETVAPSPSGSAVVTEAIPPYYLAYAGPRDSVALTVRDGSDGSTVRDLTTPSGPPINASLSPDGRWLAYITQVGLKGTNMYWAMDIQAGIEVQLGESFAGSPFLEGLFWSADGRFLLYTLGDWQGDAGTDAWLFDTTDRSVEQLTRLGSAYAAAWRTESAGRSTAWISLAAQDPVSYELPDLDGLSLPLRTSDLAQARTKADGVFQPLWNRPGDALIFWRGSMQFTTDACPCELLGGSPYIVGNVGSDPAAAMDDATPLFSDVTIGANAFTSAAITWGGTDAYAVWDAQWSGTPQSSDGSAYPDSSRVYFSHLSDDRNIQAGHALDLADVPDGAYVSSVAIAPSDVDFLAITVGFPAPGDLAVPKAEVRVIKRNTGSVADELIETLSGSQEGWFGPAVYP